MLSENPDDEEIDRMLHELGHPRDIAANYTEKKALCHRARILC